MMKFMVLFLLLTSLVSASSESEDQKLVTREGHGVVVEYDKQGEKGNTKISVRPQDQCSKVKIGRSGDAIEKVKESNSDLLGVVHLFGISVAFGMSIWMMMFVSSYIKGGALPRQQFGMVQRKLYSTYLRIQVYCVGVAVTTHLLSNRRRVFCSRSEVLYGVTLFVSLCTSFSNLLYWEPLATKIMLKMMKLEREEVVGRVSFLLDLGVADDPGHPFELRVKKAMLSNKLESLNRISSYANIVTLMSLSLPMVYLCDESGWF